MPKKTGDQPMNPAQLLEAAEDSKAQARINALQLVEESLSSHIMPQEAAEALIADICRAIGVDKEVAEAARQKRLAVGTGEGGFKKASRRSNVDDHNEVCEVCDKGGDLLCCDTCSLVFHVRCIRPKLGAVPKGKWSCAYCVLENLAEGDLLAAKKAIRRMTRLGRGVGSEDEAANDADCDSLRISPQDELTISRKGSKFIVRRSEHQLVEVEKFLSVEEALGYVKDVGFRQRQGQRDEAAAEGESGALVTERPETQELWCAQCMDDPAVKLCVFCGCKKCYGKYDSHLLVLCDHCDRETHTYCLDPPLAEVPLEDPWYCQSCSASGAFETGVGMLEDWEDMDEEDPGDGTYSDMEAGGPKKKKRKDDDSVEGMGRKEVFTYKKWGRGFKKISSTVYTKLDAKGGPRGKYQTKAALAAAAVAAHSGAMPKQRGRGRPPGSGRRQIALVGQSGLIGGPAIQGMSAHSRADFNVAAAAAAANAAAYRGAGARAAAAVGAGAVGDKRGRTVSAQEEQQRRDRERLGPVGVTSALALIERVGQPGQVRWGAAERTLLQQLRYWAPVEDRQAALEALLQKRLELIQRVQAVDAAFVPPAIEDFSDERDGATSAMEVERGETEGARDDPEDVDPSLAPAPKKRAKKSSGGAKKPSSARPKKQGAADTEDPTAPAAPAAPTAPTAPTAPAPELGNGEAAPPSDLAGPEITAAADEHPAAQELGTIV